MRLLNRFIVAVSILVTASASAQQVITLNDLDPGCAPYVSRPTPNENTAAAKVTFTNNRDADIYVGWVNFEGNVEIYDQLPPNVSYSSNSYVNHVWVMIDSRDRKCVMGTAVRNDGEVHIVK